jgi:hypothetical protein
VRHPSAVVAVGYTGGVRTGYGGGVSRCPPPRLRQALAARRGQARAGSREPRQGEEAPHHPGLTYDCTRGVGRRAPRTPLQRRPCTAGGHPGRGRAPRATRRRAPTTSLPPSGRRYPGGRARLWRGSRRHPPCGSGGPMPSPWLTPGRSPRGRPGVVPTASGRAQRGPGHERLAWVAGDSDRGLTAGPAVEQEGRQPVADVKAVQATREADHGPCEQCPAAFQALREPCHGRSDPTRPHMGRVMAHFASGLGVGGDNAELPQDHREWARWCRHPKGHARRMQGHRHVGGRRVQAGPTLLLALDAHEAHPGLCTAGEVRPYGNAPAPTCQRQARPRRMIMRKARSTKNRSLLLADLECRYLNGS